MVGMLKIIATRTAQAIVAFVIPMMLFKAALPLYDIEGEHAE